ncbi:hypothetical protein [Corynebacterium riegelii]|uniref:Uncharacterized protein n=1 Tax=Corynebacterium riegelii TaxID=156976 RepID=A0A0K1RAB1_9CORY|nr:hypothetical protein [Corynebacterium riegelii]AKV58367.1 hypothetical protein AK829_03385 [Corynebacterium riegelii]PLA13622.1 hypothetical protein CYJ48_04795 [Corynebacterium riegelii]QQU83587.1 hypothetical protein I6I71_09375 [Corynebacterium riegelii]
MVPIQLRAGGAFMALAVVLFIFAFLAFMRGDQTYALTLRFVLTCVASLIFGAFATTNTATGGSRKQLVALGVAVALIAVGMVVPNQALTIVPTTSLALWGGGALVCALILRRFSR